MFIIILYIHFVCIAHIHIYMYIFDTHINIYLHVLTFLHIRQIYLFLITPKVDWCIYSRQ